MSCEINTEKLISSVKKRPALYDKHHSEYSCQSKKKMIIWEEVCKEVYSNWDTLRPQAKFEHFTEIQKRWKSLRTCFTRELAHQKRESKEERDNTDHKSFKKRKRYEYFNHLKFLMGFIDTRSGSEPKSTSDIDNDDDNDNEDPLNKMEIEYLPSESSPKYDILYVKNDESDVFDPNAIVETVATNSTTNAINPTESEQSVSDKLFDLLNNIKKDENNEDRLFLLSLLPCFAKLEPKKKLEAKIEILKVLNDKTE